MLSTKTILHRTCLFLYVFHSKWFQIASNLLTVIPTKQSGIAILIIKSGYKGYKRSLVYSKSTNINTILTFCTLVKAERISVVFLFFIWFINQILLKQMQLSGFQWESRNDRKEDKVSVTNLEISIYHGSGSHCFYFLNELC